MSDERDELRKLLEALCKTTGAELAGKWTQLLHALDDAIAYLAAHPVTK